MTSDNEIKIGEGFYSHVSYKDIKYNPFYFNIVGNNEDTIIYLTTFPSSHDTDYVCSYKNFDNIEVYTIFGAPLKITHEQTNYILYGNNKKLASFTKKPYIVVPFKNSIDIN